MCRPASFIVTRERVCMSDDDSHETMIRAAGLSDDGRDCEFVRVEIVPPGDDYTLSFDQWEFGVDQDTLPGWWNAEWAEQVCRDELPRWAETHIIRAGECTIGEGQSRVVLGGVITSVNGGDVYACAGSTIQTVSGGWVCAFDNATIQTVSGGYVYGYDSATIQTVSGGYVRAHDNATIQTVNGGRVYAFAGSTIIDDQRPAAASGSNGGE